MKNKDIILQVDDLSIIKKAKEVGITTFLFPVSKYSVGYPKTFEIKEIKDDSFILINRNLDNDDIDSLKDVLQNTPKNIKGVVFEDLGLINVLKDTNLIKIYNAKHLNCSTLSVKALLKYVDSVILSTDLTIDEINTILDNTSKKSSVYAFGLNSIFYSRRTLITNYSQEYHLSFSKEIDVLENNSQQFFKVVENEYGTVFYSGKFYDGLRLLQNDNAKYFLVNTSYLNKSQSLKLLDNFKKGDYSVDNLDIDTSFYNLDKATYYKLPPKEGDKNV